MQVVRGTMNKRVHLIGVVALLGASLAARAALVPLAYWDLDSAVVSTDWAADGGTAASGANLHQEPGVGTTLVSMSDAGAGNYYITYSKSAANAIPSATLELKVLSSGGTDFAINYLAGATAGPPGQSEKVSQTWTWWDAAANGGLGAWADPLAPTPLLQAGAPLTATTVSFGGLNVAPDAGGYVTFRLEAGSSHKDIAFSFDSFQVVPEPSQALVVAGGLGLLGLAEWGRRRHSGPGHYS